MRARARQRGKVSGRIHRHFWGAGGPVAAMAARASYSNRGAVSARGILGGFFARARDRGTDPADRRGRGQHAMQRMPRRHPDDPSAQLYRSLAVSFGAGADRAARGGSVHRCRKPHFAFLRSVILGGHRASARPWITPLVLICGCYEPGIICELSKLLLNLYLSHTLISAIPVCVTAAASPSSNPDRQKRR